VGESLKEWAPSLKNLEKEKRWKENEDNNMAQSVWNRRRRDTQEMTDYAIEGNTRRRLEIS